MTETFADENLVFVDCETTGLDPDRHEIWEVGAYADRQFWRWFLPVDLGKADPVSLKIGGYYDRFPHEGARPLQPGDLDPLYTLGMRLVTQETFAAEFSALTRGKHLVGAVVSFDEERLRKLLKANNAAPAWHYHLVDVEALVAGKYGIAPPWNSDELSALAGVDPTKFERHSALGDVEWAMALYQSVMTT